MIAIGTLLTIGWLFFAFIVTGNILALGMLGLILFLTLDTNRRDQKSGRIRDPRLQFQGETWGGLLFIITIVIVYMILTGQFSSR